MLVQHWMIRDVVTVEAETPFLEARLILRDFRLDLRSLVTCALHTRPGYRDFVIRVKGEQADALVKELKAKYGEGVSILVT